jgi:hypothetical protein
MRCSHSFLSSLLVLATPAAVGAETTIYLMGPVEVPPPLVLLVGGLALLGLGALSRRWRARARPPEPERSDGLEPAFLSPMIVGSPVSDAAQTTTITSVVAARRARRHATGYQAAQARPSKPPLAVVIAGRLDGLRGLRRTHAKVS